MKAHPTYSWVFLLGLSANQIWFGQSPLHIWLLCRLASSYNLGGTILHPHSIIHQRYLPRTICGRPIYNTESLLVHKCLYSRFLKTNMRNFCLRFDMCSFLYVRMTITWHGKFHASTFLHCVICQAFCLTIFRWVEFKES